MIVINRSCPGTGKQNPAAMDVCYPSVFVVDHFGQREAGHSSCIVYGNADLAVGQLVFIALALKVVDHPPSGL